MSASTFDASLSGRHLCVINVGQAWEVLVWLKWLKKGAIHGREKTDEPPAAVDKDADRCGTDPGESLT